MDILTLRDSKPRIEMLFYTGTGLYEQNIMLLRYKYSHTTKGYLIQTGAQASHEKVELYSIPVLVDVLMRLHNNMQVKRVHTLLHEIYQYDPTILDRISPDFYDFLSIYVQQKKIRIGAIRRRLYYALSTG